MRLDLHTHSTASDGTLGPTELVGAAVRAGLDAVALTDHDSMEGLAEAGAAARSSGITLVPGVELSVGPDEQRDVHILGYFVDPTDTSLQDRLGRMRVARLERATRMVASLRDAGYGISLDEVLELADCGAVGRSHVARMLVKRGHADSVDEAFDRFLARGRPFYHPKPAADPTEAVRVLLAAGALPVLAHPGVSRVDDLIPALVDAGLAGLEAFHADHSPDERLRYERLAHSYGLLVTGGSDHHGPGTPSADLGSVPIPAYVWPALLEAAPAWFRQGTADA
jgi:hypothetical protein